MSGPPASKPKKIIKYLKKILKSNWVCGLKRQDEEKFMDLEITSIAYKFCPQSPSTSMIYFLKIEFKETGEFIKIEMRLAYFL